MLKVAVFVSGSGSNLQSLIDYNGSFEISLVISDKKDAYGLKRAKNHGIKNEYIGKENFPNIQNRNDEILRVLKENDIDFIVLAGFLSIVDEKIVNEYKNKIINIHPSLIPSFCGIGFYGKRVHDAVYKSGVKFTGATVHFVDAGVDTGRIIAQDIVSITDTDTIDTIAEKVLEIEHKILPKTLDDLCFKK